MLLNPMDDINLERVTNRASDIIKEVGAFICRESKKFNQQHVELKGHNDLVSYVDKSAEEMLVKMLGDILPGCGFILEEKTSAENSKSLLKWIVDPLDGTTNFVHGVPCYCISVALAINDVIEIGIVYEINRDELFKAWKNGGAYLNNVPISVSKAESPALSLVATGFPYTDFSFMDQYMQIFHYCMKNTRGLRRLGSAAADLAYVACGRFDAFYEYGLNSWDVAAGSLIVAEAGGVVTDFKGEKDFVYGREILAANNNVHNDFLAVIKASMG
jgi:myo-inositol-1(or 4)-monophosphatase